VKKKNQHYVFQAYLKPWAENAQVYCLRDGEIFRTNLKNVACERFFYRLQELTPDEVRLIERSLVEHSVEPLKKVQREFIAMYSFPPKMRKALDRNPKSKLRSGLDEVIANLGEDFHQKVEGSLLGFLNSMLAGSTDFYSDKKQAAEFLAALCLQFTRACFINSA